MSCCGRPLRRWRGHGHRAQCARIAVAALIEAAVQHDAAADERADEEIHIVAIAVADAEGQLRRAGRGRVVAEIDRAGEGLGDLLPDIEAAPFLQHIVRGADFAFPVPDLEGGGDADAADARRLRRREVRR